MPSTNDTRVVSYQPLVAPHDILAELPMGPERTALVADARAEVKRVIDGDDDRLLVIVGPCSVHDPASALEYARRLRALIPEVASELCVVMRVYFEKPRTTLGWKGLINDPGLDESFDVHRGLRTARKLLLDIGSLGIAAGTEFLDPITPQYIADAVSWGAIGARTTESQVHRQLGSGLSMPVGFKNGTDGDVQVAVDACRAAAGPHTFFGVDPNGAGAVVTTSGNPDCHVILRGGRSGPNYDAASVSSALDVVAGAGLPRRLMIDASHANSGKDHLRQPGVAREIAAQIAEGQRGITGVMLESFLVPGAQKLDDPASLTYGQSITDKCMGWETTEEVLAGLADAVRNRRKAGN